MSTRLNSNIAEALDMELPEEIPLEDSAPMVVVEPHELAVVDNPDLPDMTDLDIKSVEADKQLEILIQRGMGMFTDLYKELPDIEPKYRARHLEVTAQMMGTTLDAIRHKSEHQLKRKKARLEEANFGKTTGDTKIGTANFYGTREELLKMIANAETAEATEAAVTPDDDSE